MSAAISRPRDSSKFDHCEEAEVPSDAEASSGGRSASPRRDRVNQPALKSCICDCRNYLTRKTIRPCTLRSATALIASAAPSRGSTRSIRGLSLPSPTHAIIISATRAISSGKRSFHAPVKTPTIEKFFRSGRFIANDGISPLANPIGISRPFQRMRRESTPNTFPPTFSTQTSSPSPPVRAFTRSRRSSRE